MKSGTALGFGVDWSGGMTDSVYGGGHIGHCVRWPPGVATKLPAVAFENLCVHI
jgi:hypothetical protein